jgi:hypothetical protein
MTENDCFKTGRKIAVKGIMVHSTATPGVMAAKWFQHWNKPGVKACVHAFLDDKEVWQYLPWNHRGWHGGGSSNNTHVSFEICEPPGHTYKPGSGVMYGYDVKKQESYFRAAWKNAVDLCAMLCKQHDLTEQNIICHSEGYKLGVASNSGDVMHWLPKYGESMDTFRAAVQAALKPSVITKPEEPDMTQERFDAMFKAAMERYNKDLTTMPPSNWAKGNWERMVAAGMFDGTSPRAPLSREQAATLFAKLRT